MQYDGAMYYYIKNLQGDVLRMVDASGNVVATYVYDAWGKVLYSAGSMAGVNSFRYRGYYYDGEAGLYYLQSRYYDPYTGRFLNADAFTSTGQGILGNNMFAYCNNNPVNACDKNGKAPDTFAGWVGEELGKIVYEWIAGEDHPSREAERIEAKIIQKQNESIQSVTKVMWNAWVHSNELKAQAQYEQDMHVISKVEYVSSDPWITTDVIIGGIGLGTTYIGYAAFAAGVSIPVVGQVALGIVGLACSVYGLARVLYPSNE